MAVVKASMPVSPVKVASAVTVMKLAPIGAYLEPRAVPPSEIEAKAAAPASETDHCASLSTNPVLVEEPIIITPPVALVPMLMVWVLAAVPIEMVPLPDPDVPTSILMLPAVLLVELPVAIVNAPVLEVAPPEALPEVMDTAAELVPPAVWFKDLRVSIPVDPEDMVKAPESKMLLVVNVVEPKTVPVANVGAAVVLTL